MLKSTAPSVPSSRLPQEKVYNPQAQLNLNLNGSHPQLDHGACILTQHVKSTVYKIKIIFFI